MSDYKENYPVSVLDEIRSKLTSTFSYMRIPDENLNISFNDREKAQVLLHLGYKVENEDGGYFASLWFDAYYIEPILEYLNGVIERKEMISLSQFIHDVHQYRELNYV